MIFTGLRVVENGVIVVMEDDNEAVGRVEAVVGVGWNQRNELI